MTVTAEQVRELGDRGEALREAIQRLQSDLAIVEEVAGIEKRTKKTEDRGKINRLLVIALLVGSLALGGLFIKVRDNTNTIKSVQCSLYSLLLSGGYHPENHLDDLGTTPQRSLDVYNHAYKQIIVDNNRLGCVVKAENPDYVTDPSQVPSK